MSDKNEKSYKGSSFTKQGQVHTNKSHREHMNEGKAQGGTKDPKKGIKKSFAGRHLHETEHHSRMQHQVRDVSPIPGVQGDGATEM